MDRAMFGKLNYYRRHRRCFLFIAATSLVFALPGVSGSARAQAGQTALPDPRAMKMHPMPATAVQLPVESKLPSLRNATAWLNSGPLTAAGLRGKVVLVEFWTYSCINWRRQLPYVRAWAEKYKDQGLVVIGVHAPEFRFEKDIDNVRWAVKDMRVNYPVVIDNGYPIWHA